MYLLPKPKKLEIKENNLKSKRVNIKNLCDDVRIEKVLSDFPKDTNGVLLTVSAANEESEGYTLTILPDEIKIAGESTAGAFYGIQTLKQIFEKENEYDECKSARAVKSADKQGILLGIPVSGLLELF